MVITEIMVLNTEMAQNDKMQVWLSTERKKYFLALNWVFYSFGTRMIRCSVWFNQKSIMSSSSLFDDQVFFSFYKIQFLYDFGNSYQVSSQSFL